MCKTFYVLLCVNGLVKLANRRWVFLSCVTKPNIYSCRSCISSGEGKCRWCPLSFACISDLGPGSTCPNSGSEVYIIMCMYIRMTSVILVSIKDEALLVTSWTCGKSRLVAFGVLPSFLPSLPPSPPSGRGIYECSPSINTSLSPTGHLEMHGNWKRKSSYQPILTLSIGLHGKASWALVALPLSLLQWEPGTLFHSVLQSV